MVRGVVQAKNFQQRLGLFQVHMRVQVGFWASNLSLVEFGNFKGLALFLLFWLQRSAFGRSWGVI